MNQTTVQKEKALRFGSLKVEIGNTPSTLVDIGALRDVSFEGKGEITALAFDNAPERKLTKDMDKFSLNATLCEINFSNLSIMSGGMIDVTNVAGALVSGDTFTMIETEWEFDKAVELTGQNSTGAVPTINSVTGSVSGSTSDYKLVKLPNGNWAISIDNGGAIATIAEDVVVNYDYTPSASKKVTFKSKGILADRFMRLTNTDQYGNTKVVTMKGVANIEALNINFASDDENEVATTPISLEGYIIDIIDAQQTV